MVNQFETRVRLKQSRRKLQILSTLVHRQSDDGICFYFLATLAISTLLYSFNFLLLLLLGLPLLFSLSLSNSVFYSQSKEKSTNGPLKSLETERKNGAKQAERTFGGRIVKGVT